MKRLLPLLLCLFTFGSMQIYALLDDGDAGSEKIDALDVSDRGPFRFEFEFDSIAAANTNKKNFTDRKLQFSQYCGLLNLAVGYIPEFTEVYCVAAGLCKDHMTWQDNPYFSQTNFYNAIFAFRFFTMRMQHWQWRGEFAINVDAENWNFNEFANYDLTVWGRYEYCDHIGLHVGFTAQTGMKIDHMYPILGVEWKINKKWSLNLVFPVDISLEYQHSENWTSELAMRFFDIRHRVNKDEPLSYGLFCYRNAGIEYGLNYEYDPVLEVNIHVGYTVGGLLRISTQHNHDPHHFNIDPSGYVGGELVWSF